jgi:hypothetical protein
LNKDKSIKTTPAWLFPLIIIVFAFIIYGNSIRNDYSLDDVIVTAVRSDNNSRIQEGIAGIPGLFTSRYLDAKQQNYGYRPLVLTTFAIEYQFFKRNPHVSHFINLLIYAFTCILLFFILSNLFSSYHKILPFLTTLLFIAHPLHTEVVDSIKNRDELMVFLFGLCSLHYVLKYFDTKKLWLIFISLLFLFLALLSKETAIIFLPVIPLTIYFFKPVKLSKIIIAILIVLLTYIIYFFIKRFLLHTAPTASRLFIFTENPLFYEHHMLKRFFPALFILLYYLKLFLFPYPFCSYYGYDTITMAGWTNPWVWVSLIIYLGLAVYALINIQKKSIISFGILFYLIGIVPFSNFLKPAPGIVAERFTYTASLGFCIVVAFFLLNIFKIPFEAKAIIKKFKTQFVVVIIIILGLYSSLTISRNYDWKDVMTLYSSDLKHFDESYNLHYLFVTNLKLQINKTSPGTLRDQMINELMEHQRRIAELVSRDIAKYPKDYISRNNLGDIYANYLNDQNSAQPFFRQAISVKPDYTEAYLNLAYSYEKSNNIDSAIYYYNKTLKLDSSFSFVYSRLFEIYTNKGDYHKAFEIDEKSIKIFPNDAEFYVNSGNTSLLLKDTLNGIKYFEKAVDIEPANHQLRSQIVNFLKKAGFSEKAKQLE